MSAVFRMPSLGADMEAGTLTEWLIAPGDRVSRGDVVAVVETQKGAIEVEIFETGRIARLLATVGDRLPVGAPMAEVEGTAEARPEPVIAAAAPVQSSAQPPEHETPLPAAEVPVRPAAEGPGIGAAPPSSPAARQRAAALGIDMVTLRGSGPGGAIVLQDVESAVRAATPGAPDKAPAARFDPTAMRAAVAAAMARSKREIPHYYLSQEIDLTRASEWLTALNATRPPTERLLMGLILVRAAAIAAARAPSMNGFFGDGRFRHCGRVHAGVAVALRGGGLVAPALHDADSRDLDDLMAAMRELVARARSGRLRSSDIADPTITVSSLGERGADALFGILFPPQVALVGFGTPAERPAVVGGRVVPRLRVTATLAADHRVSDGRQGAQFLAAIDALLQEPEAL